MAHSDLNATFTETIAIRPMQTNQSGLPPIQQRWIKIEFWLLILVSPLLLFPTVTYWGTTLSITLLVAIWIGSSHFYRIAIFSNLPFTFTLKLLICATVLAVLVSTDYDLTYRKAVGIFLGLCWLRIIARTAYLPHSNYYLWGPFTVFSGAIIGFGILTASFPTKIPALRPLILLLPQNNLLLPNSPTAGTHVNQLAGALTLVIPVTAAWLFSTKSVFRRIQRVIAPVILLLLSTIIVLTQSRTAYFAVTLSLLLGLVLYYLINAPLKIRIASAIASGTACILCVLLLLSVAPLLPAINPDTVTAIGYLDTIAFRQEIWYWAIEAIYDFPYTGTGLGTFRRVAQRIYPVAINLDYDGTHAHNIFLQVAVDIGVFGLISYCALLLATAFMAWSVAAESIEHKAMAIGLLCGIISVHIFGLSDALVLGSKPGILFWIELGMIGHLSIVARGITTT